MAEPSSRKPVTVALISAFATIVVALVGLAPTFLRGKPDAAPPEKVARPLPKETPRPEPPSSPPATPPSRAVVAASGDQPPIKISYRRSKILGQGMVAGLTNTAEGKTLRNVIVLVRSPGDGHDRTYRVARSLRANGTVSVGWRELDGWKLEPGDRLKVKADGYPGCVESVVPRK
jgi:hypothetical protein